MHSERRGRGEAGEGAGQRVPAAGQARPAGHRKTDAWLDETTILGCAMPPARTRGGAALALLGTLAACAAPSAQLARQTPPNPDAAPKPGSGWVQVTRNPQGVLFVDPRATLRVGSSVFLTLLDAKRGSTVSIRERVEIDCVGKRIRRHDSSLHGDHAALGPALARAGQNEWRDLHPDPKTVFTALANLACPGSGSNAPETPGAAPPAQKQQGVRNT